MILDSDEDFTIIDDKRALKASVGEGGTIKYTKQSVHYKQLNDFEKMNYAVYMTKYNVFDKKDYGESARYTQNTTKFYKLFYDPIFLVRRWNSMLLILSIALFVIMIFLFILMRAYYMFGLNLLFANSKSEVLDDGEARKTNLFRLILFCGLLGLTGFVINLFFEKTMSRIEIIQYYIK